MGISEVPNWHIHLGFYGYIKLQVNDFLSLWFRATVVRYIFDEYIQKIPPQVQEDKNDVLGVHI